MARPEGLRTIRRSRYGVARAVPVPRPYQPTPARSRITVRVEKQGTNGIFRYGPYNPELMTRHA